MILYDSIQVQIMTTDRYGSPVLGPIQTFPAQVDPLGTTESIFMGGERVNTRYKMVTTVDLSKMGDATAMEITWQGQYATLDGGFERHTIMGQFSHVECFLKIGA